MRNLFLVLLSTVFLFVGCSEDCPTQPTYELKLNSVTYPLSLFSVDSTFLGEKVEDYYVLEYRYTSASDTIANWDKFQYYRDIFHKHITGSAPLSLIMSNLMTSIDDGDKSKEANIYYSKNQIRVVITYRWHLKENDDYFENESRYEHTLDYAFGYDFNLNPAKQEIQLFY